MSCNTNSNARDARYSPAHSYRWNFDHPPGDPEQSAVVPVPGSWEFCGLPAASPLGMAAGPLLNGRWCLHYAALGFDVLTYKTVRSGSHECYPLPNLVPVDCEMMSDDVPAVVDACRETRPTWAVSFGMPSRDPDFWREDVAWTRQRLPAEKLLSVSVVGTMQADWSIEQLAEDYARCAAWAVESGADCVETNFSCPNVTTCDGQLYQNPLHSGIVASAVRSAIGDVPLIVKIGHCRDDLTIDRLLEATSDRVDAFAMTNSIAAKVSQGTELLFDGQQRGICGHAIRDESIRQVERFASRSQRAGCTTQIIGVGGISTADDVQRYMNAGAHACHLATAAMLNPEVALQIRRDLAAPHSH